MERRFVRHGFKHGMDKSIRVTRILQRWRLEIPPSWSEVKPRRVRLDVPCFLQVGIILVLENV